MTQRVLFVDDMPDMGALIVDMLQFEGIDADWCGSGPEAIERLRSGRYAVLVTDLILGGPVDGRVLAGMARDARRPALVVSGDADAIDALQSEGVDAVLKPLEMPALLAWLRAHCPALPAAANG